ncbi:MAG: PorV/PorQ family protein [Candidatus Eisenbacteria sp.]|nr:PorV/PorQ family protein [Candidatus Eisenbacteria bacterium]
MTRKLLLGLLVVLVLTSQALATDVFEKVGTVGCQFLEIGAGPRGVGMGEAMVAATEGVESIYWNPAGLRSIVRPTVAFAYGTWPADISHQFAAFAMRDPVIGGVAALSITSLRMDPMLVRTADSPGGVGVEFDPGDIAIGVSYAREFTDKFAAGGTLKWVHSGLADLSALGVEGLEDYSARGFVGDFGTLYNTGFRSLTIGLMIQNMGPEMTYIEEPVPMPATFKFGVSMNVIETPGQIVKVAAEFRHPSDTSEKVNVGAEYVLNDMYFLRAGYKMGYDEESFTAGCGARLTVGGLGRLGVDYSYAAFGYFSGVHRGGVTVEF